MSAGNVTDRDLRNYERVHPFITFVYSHRKYKDNEDRIKNFAIQALNENRDLVGDDLLSKIDIHKILAGSIHDISNEDVKVIYDYFVDNYHTQDMISAYFIREANNILDEYVNTNKVDFSRLYMYFRNNQLYSKIYEHYGICYPARVLSLLKLFILKYNHYDWRHFYLTENIVLDILNCFIFDETYSGNLLNKVLNIYSNFVDYDDYKRKKERELRFIDWNALCNKKPLAMERVESGDNKNTYIKYYNKLNDKDDKEYDKKIIYTLDHYYITKLYNSLVAKSYNKMNSLFADSNFLEIILNNYLWFVEDFDHVKKMIKNDKTLDLFNKFLSKDIEDIKYVALNISTEFREYILNRCATRASEANLSYNEIKDFLI